MTTTTVPIIITCPDWCTVRAEEHAAELWNNEAHCFHHAEDVEVPDPTGHLAPLQEPRLYGPIRLSLTTTTRPDGTEAESPTFRIDEVEHSMDQMLALADAIHQIVATYRGETEEASR